MTLKELIEKKKALGMTNEMIAERSEVPLGTVQKIFAGITKTPRYDTLLALEHALQQEELQRLYIKQENLPDDFFDKYSVEYTWPTSGRATDASRVKESEVAYNWETYASQSGTVDRMLGKKQGTYTIDDYYALPDDRRAELIDGVIYDMGAPTRRHQAIIGYMHTMFFNCANTHDYRCIPYMAPVDVRIMEDDKNMFEPDVVVLCRDGDNDERLRDSRRIEGAPDFVLEVLSPSTRRRDLFLKVTKYKMAGVREYWIIDPDRETLTVYDLEAEEAPITYLFNCTVPVRISDGDLSIDLQQLKEHLEKMQV